MKDMENKIGTALMRLRAAFAKYGVPCPDFLVYDDTAKAYRAMQMLRHGLGPAAWGMRSDASPVGECVIGSFTIRFEPQTIERPGTGAELDDGVSRRVFFDGHK